MKSATAVGIIILQLELYVTLARPGSRLTLTPYWHVTAEEQRRRLAVFAVRNNLIIVGTISRSFHWPLSTGSAWGVELRKKIMRVSECMTREVRFARPEATLRDAAKAMAVLDIGLLPVAENERLVGMITDRDIAVRGVAVGLRPEAPVSDVMSKDVKYCFDDEEIDSVLENMGETQVRRLPVLNREKRLVGIVSIGDLAMNGEAVHAGEALGDISKPGGEHSQTSH